MMRCSEALIFSITAAATVISKELTKDQMQLLSAAAIQFGDTLATIAAADELYPYPIAAPPPYGAARQGGRARYDCG